MICFHWELEFPEVFYEGVHERENPGFDAVIGNPPYSSKLSSQTKQLRTLFELVSYKCDPFAFFVERGLKYVRTSGYLGFITPSTWMGNTYYEDLRRQLIESESLRSVLLFDGLVFASANVDTSIILANKENVSERQFALGIAKPEAVESAR